MDKELHEKALEEALDVILDVHKAGLDTVSRAIAAYLKTAGLTVVPVEPNERMIMACNECINDYEVYKAMLAAFPSPFDEVK